MEFCERDATIALANAPLFGGDKPDRHLKCIAAPVPTGEHAMETGAPSAGGVNNHI
jgi:hypothetical protein